MRTIYFAYGSNLDADQMQQRCPDSPPWGPAQLERWQFRINHRGYATLVPAPDAIVHGLLWCLTSADEAELDRYEGVREGLYAKRQLQVLKTPHRAVEAMVYLAADHRPGIPRPGYLEKIISAAQQHRFPAEYVRELERWSVPV